MMKVQEFYSTTCAMTIGAYRFNRRNVVRAWGSSADVARALFEYGEVQATATIHFQQGTGEEPEMWAERVFPSRNTALAFLFGQAVRFSLEKRTREASDAC